MTARDKYSQRHEREVAQALGGEVVAQSGAGAQKLDVLGPRGPADWRLRVSCKSTVGKSIGITRAMIDEAEVATAFSYGERPAIALRFYDEKGNRVLKDLIAVTIDDWVEREQRTARLEDELRRRGGDFGAGRGS